MHTYYYLCCVEVTNIPFLLYFFFLNSIQPLTRVAQPLHVCCEPLLVGSEWLFVQWPFLSKKLFPQFLWFWWKKWILLTSVGKRNHHLPSLINQIPVPFQCRQIGSWFQLLGNGTFPIFRLILLGSCWIGCVEKNMTQYERNLSITKQTNQRQGLMKQNPWRWGTPYLQLLPFQI